MWPLTSCNSDFRHMEFGISSLLSVAVVVGWNHVTYSTAAAKLAHVQPPSMLSCEWDHSEWDPLVNMVMFTFYFIQNLKKKEAQLIFNFHCWIVLY